MESKIIIPPKKRFIPKPFSLFLNEKFIMVVIIINAIIIFVQACHADFLFLDILDVICTFIFLAEMTVKHIHLGFKDYWRKGMNAMDGTIVLLTLPSLINIIAPDTFTDISFIITLRTLRIFRFFRLVHLFPGFPVIAQNFMLAMRQSYAVFIGLFIFIIIFALIGTSLFGELVPQYFDTPIEGIYTTFRIFTIEGWYEIPDTIAEAMGSSIWAYFVRIYFCVVLFTGGIIGMSLLNSIFVDAMVSDNNDDVKAQLKKIEKKVTKIQEVQAQNEQIAELKNQVQALTALIEKLQNIQPQIDAKIPEKQDEAADSTQKSS